MSGGKFSLRLGESGENTCQHSLPQFYFVYLAKVEMSSCVLKTDHHSEVITDTTSAEVLKIALNVVKTARSNERKTINNLQSRIIA